MWLFHPLQGLCGRQANKRREPLVTILVTAEDRAESENPARSPKTKQGFNLHQWAWVDSNYRPQAYQISAGRSWALETGGFGRICARGRSPALASAVTGFVTAFSPTPEAVCGHQAHRMRFGGVLFQESACFSSSNREACAQLRIRSLKKA